MVDFDRFEPRDRNLQVLVDEKFRQLRQLDGKALTISARVVGNLVVGQK
jgi:hypothetical protein